MFFFRETPFYLKTKSSKDEKALGVFVAIKIILHGQVSLESGMILNLKDVDFALSSVKKNFPVMKSKPQAFLKLYQQLENLLGDYFYQLEMSWDQHSVFKNKKSFYRSFKTHLWFQEDDVLVKRAVWIQYKKQGHVLFKKIRDVQASCHMDDFLILMRGATSEVSEIRIAYPEMRGERVVYEKCIDDCKRFNAG